MVIKALKMNIFHPSNQSNGTFDIGNSIIHKKNFRCPFLKGKNENIVILCYV